MFSRIFTAACLRPNFRVTSTPPYQACRLVNSFPVVQARCFSTLNENELIEYVEGKVFEVLKQAAKCKHEKLSRTVSFEELGFDSLDGVELVLAMEEYFGFDISNTEAEKITSVMDAIQIFHAHEVKRRSVATTQDGAESKDE